MAFLDVISPGVASTATVPQAIRLVDRISTAHPVTVRWMLRLATFLLLLLATFVGVQLAMSAPTVSPVAANSQQTVARGST